ncbi:MAG: spermidine/putrescine ABC transporter substrate-binding protein [Planctomycetota bacterium]|jgi:spermidine/putrescine transport system substrate-binding protein|nr:spermidine/putrescine ABC transporter substrate-binding protein [Planctomycetota bacterium]
MRPLATSILTLCVLLSSANGTLSGEKAILHVFTWSEYFDEDVLAEFEEAHDCHVAIDLFDSNEAMYGEIVNGPYEYDIVTPSSYMSSRMRKEGMILELDHSLIPNLVNIDPGFVILTEDPEMRHSIPYTRTVSGVGYNAAELPALEDTWEIFARADLTGRMTMLDDMRETIGAALKYLGYSLNSTDEGELARAETLLQSWRRNLLRFEVDEAHLGLASGEVVVAHGYNGDVSQLMDVDPDIAFLVPREGSAITSDDFVLLKETANYHLAHQFINHMLEPRVAAMNMQGILYYMPNPEAFAMLPAALRDNPAFSVPAEALDRCEVPRDLGDDTGKYEAIWERLGGGE